MKKLRFIFILSLLMVFCFSLGQVFTTAQTDEAEADWDVNNTVTLTVKAEYVDEVLKDIPGAFSKIDFKTAYITGMAENEHLCMIIVLNNSGDAQQQAAADILSADPRFKFVHKSCDAPFKTENTLHLVASANSVNAKKTFTIKPEGTLKVYEQLMDYTRILVSLKNYDPNKEYTPADFPQFNFSAVEKAGNETIGIYFILTLSQPSYYNVYKAVNALASAPTVRSVYPDSFASTCEDHFPIWEVSDLSVVDFANKVSNMGEDSDAIGYEEGNPVGYPINLNENGEVVFNALKPGKVTVTYVPAINHSSGRAYAVTYDITVVEEDVLTSDSGMTVYLAIGILSVGAAVFSLVLRKIKFSTKL